MRTRENQYLNVNMREREDFPAFHEWNNFKNRTARFPAVTSQRSGFTFNFFSSPSVSLNSLSHILFLFVLLAFFHQSKRKKKYFILSEMRTVFFWIIFQSCKHFLPHPLISSRAAVENESKAEKNYEKWILIFDENKKKKKILKMWKKKEKINVPFKNISIRHFIIHSSVVNLLNCLYVVTHLNPDRLKDMMMIWGRSRGHKKFISSSCLNMWHCLQIKFFLLSLSRDDFLFLIWEHCPSIDNERS